MNDSKKNVSGSTDYVTRHLELLARAATDKICQKHPEWESRFGAAGRTKCHEDARFHLLHLREALRTESPILFEKYISWVRILLDGLKIGTDDLVHFLLAIEHALPTEHEDPEHVNQVRNMLQIGLLYLSKADPESLKSNLPASGPYVDLSRDYLDAILALRRRDALKIILDTANAGTSIRDIYLEVFQPVQREIGRLWQTNQISVASEHYCTATTQWVMSQLYPMIMTDKLPDRRVIAVCVGGELHDIGIRMVADLFELAGWESMYLGANVPVSGVISAIHGFQPHLLAVSVTLLIHLATMDGLIKAVRQEYTLQQLPIMVGGIPFLQDKNMWKKMNANCFAQDAEAAVSEAHKLLGSTCGDHL
ncbi:MAG: cobalamin-dependent protein [Magnetococcales bacterium]|nr:cobalamin-dependent protein [Magnetococcales bacterium]